MTLMTDEKILLESEPKGITLTTHRIRSEDEHAGTTTIKSIMLEELASCAVVQSNNPILLVIAAICAIIGLVATMNSRGDATPFVIGLVIGGIFVVAYFASRQQVLALASSGTTIATNAEGHEAASH